MEWLASKQLVEYPHAVAEMEKRVAAIRAGTLPEAVWLVEHPPLYTAGTSAKDSDLLAAPFPVYHTGRGGQYTYHGPGQRVAYVMLDLQKRGGDIRKYVWQLEEWIIRSLARLDIVGERREGRIGIWVASPSRHAGLDPASVVTSEAKIAAIGVRVRSGVTYHGIAINVDPDLSHYAGIIPCGIAEYGVTSVCALEHAKDSAKKMQDVDRALHDTFNDVFV